MTASAHAFLTIRQALNNMNYIIAPTKYGFASAVVLNPNKIVFTSYGSSDEALRLSITSSFPEAKEENTELSQRVIEIMKHPELFGDTSANSQYLNQVKLEVFPSHATDFQKQVWNYLLNDTQYGQTITYSDVAHALGNDTAVRAVASAIGKNEIAVIIPCHRIVNKKGGLSGYRWGLDVKKRLLDLEAAS